VRPSGRPSDASLHPLDGRAAPLSLANIDTDQIIPKQFLKTVEREGLAKGLFFDFRFDGGRAQIPTSCSTGRSTRARRADRRRQLRLRLVARARPWALMDFGIMCVISTSFADIFNNNCFNNGLLPVVLKPDEVGPDGRGEGRQPHGQRRPGRPDRHLAVGQELPLRHRSRRKEKMLKGLDFIGETLQDASAIDRFEAQQRTF
jgi:3-isopropylmalate/(R)-2-methylmalate dehydratase small subunit